MGSSKKVTVGYRYFLGMHMILCHGPVDKLVRIVVDKKTAWSGESTGGPIDINEPELFGGESREGGVSGTVDFETGSPTQGKNSYLMGKLGSSIPAFRGVAAAVLRQVYVGINPYLKNWAFRAQRIHTRMGGLAQWYDEKADIPNAVATVLEQGITLAANVYAGPGFGGPGNSLDFSANPEDVFTVESLAGAWSRWGPPIGDDSSNGGMAWTAGFSVTDGGGTTHMFYDNPSFDPPDYYPTAAAALSAQALQVPVSLTGFDKYSLHFNDAGPQPTQDVNRGSMTFKISSLSGYSHDMNPAHIVRECLTDLDWGMGYLESDIDDASFRAAADQLHLEGFGISILWDRQTPIEDFIKEIIRHINAALYVDRTSGKFVLKVVRNDYDRGSLLVLGEGQVEKVDNFSRPAFGDMINAVTVNYWDASTGTTASISAQDIALIQMQGSVVSTTIQYPGCTNPALAARLAARDLATLSTPLLSCTVYTDRTAAVLNIGDVFILDWPELLAEPTVMRVMSMGFGSGTSNQIKITATEDVFALPETTVIVPPVPIWTDPSGDPTPAEKRIVVEAPYVALFKEAGKDAVDTALSNSPLAGFIAASAVSPAGGSINATVVEDSGAGYEQQGTADFCPHAELSAPASKTDTVLQCADVGELGRVDEGDFIQVGDELVSLISIDPLLNRITVGRGVMDTVPQTHATGTTVFAWDSYAYVGQVEYAAGESVGVKLLPTTGRGVLEVDAAPADVVVMAGRAARPYPPGNVRINGSLWPSSVSGTFTVTWAHRNRLDQQDVLVPFSSGDVTPGPNNRYGLRFLDASGSVLVERSDIGPGTASVVLNYVGNVTMELYTIDDVGQSWQRHSHVFSYSPPGGPVVSAITADAYVPVDDSTIIDGGEI